MKLKYLSCSFKGEIVSCEMEEFSPFEASWEPKQHLNQLCLNQAFLFTANNVPEYGHEIGSSLCLMFSESF